VFDRFDSATKLIHYSNLGTQPWRFRGHPCGEVWFRYFREACEAGVVSDADIALAMRRGYARADLRQGNTIGLGTVTRNALSDLKASLRGRLTGNR
jgi:hypothetical protein